MKKYILVFLFALGILGPLYAQSVGEEALSFKTQKSKWGLGMEGGFGASSFFPPESLFTGFPDAWWALTLHIPETSFLLSVGLAGISGQGSYGLNANIDFPLAATSPAKWFELHMFLGLGASIYSYSNGLGLSAGLRLPLGMSFWLWRWLQAYVNVTPIVGLGLGLGSQIRLWIHLDAPLDIGVRFWF